MKSAEKIVGKTMKIALGALALTGLVLCPGARAQAPYLLPYNAQTYAGGGKAPTQNADGITYSACLNAPTYQATDALGDGCPITSGSVIVGASLDIHDVAADPQGNIYFIDNQTLGLVRRIDARSGVVQVFFGSVVAQPTTCANAYDFYGDGCPANDGAGNVFPKVGQAAGATYGYTSNVGKSRGLGVAQNGDVYVADYNSYVVNKISASSGLASLAIGDLVGTTKPATYKGTKGYGANGSLAGPIVLNNVPSGGAGENQGRGIGVDGSGNLYFSDTGNDVVRVVSASTGLIQTIAGGQGNANFGGDGTAASNAIFNGPEDSQVDAAGDIFIGDQGNARVRVIYKGGANAAKMISVASGTTPVSGNIYTIMGGNTAAAGTSTTTNPIAYTAGTTVNPISGADVGSPRKLILDARGNLYVADNTEDVIWFLDAATGYMRAILGLYGVATGTSPCPGVDVSGPGPTSCLMPGSNMGVGIDASGNVYVSDSGDARIKRLSTGQSFPAEAVGSTTTQTIQIHFGPGDSPSGTAPYTIGVSKDFSVPANSGSCTTNADTTQDCLVVVSFTPTITGPDTATLTVTSTKNGKSVIGISGTGTGTTLAFDPGAASLLSSALKTPFGVAQDAAGNTYIADTGNNRVVEISAAGAQTVVAGTGGPANTATLSGPKAVAISRTGFLYIADTGNNIIRAIDPSTGLIGTVAGGGGGTCALASDTFGNGCLGTQATLSGPSGLAVDSIGNLFISDTGNNTVRELTIGGYIFVAGGGGGLFNGPTGLAIDGSQNIFVADTGHNEVQEILSNGNTVVIAGQSTAGASGNGGTATSTSTLNGPTGLALDAANNLYIADTGNSAIRVVNTALNTPAELAVGTSLPALITTPVGALGVSGTGTLPGTAASVQLSSPSGVASNGSGQLIVLDSGNNRAIFDNRNAISNNFGRNNVNSISPSTQFTVTNSGSGPLTALGATTGTGSTNAFSLTSSISSTGCSSTTTLAVGASCLLTGEFDPPALGNFTATYTFPAATPALSGTGGSITLSGTGAVLVTTTSTTVVTTPATGSPQFAIPFVITTTVTPASCAPGAPSCVPTGTVTFFVNGTQSGIPITLSATGTASQTISGLPVGTTSVTAVYSGDGFYANSSAPALSIVLTKGATTTKVVASPNPVAQFASLTLTASVTTAVANTFPTGTITFFAGATQLTGVICGSVNGKPTIQTISTVTLSNSTGMASLADATILAANCGQTASSMGSSYTATNSFGLAAGSYPITAVYSGDSNYSGSTSAAGTLVIAPDPQTFAVSASAPNAGTAQGSSSELTITITPQNTFNGTVTFSCTGLPANTTCTFNPVSLAFAPVALIPTVQTTGLTIFTNVPAVVTAASMRSGSPLRRGAGGISHASLLGWPVLLSSLVGVVGFRRRLRTSRLLAMVAVFGLLAGSSMALTGCNNSNLFGAPTSTAVGTYTVNVVATGPNNISVSTPVAFTVTAGTPGEE